MHTNPESDAPESAAERVKAVAAEIFQTDATHIDLLMGPEDIDNWDSLNHLRLITEIEATFSVQLTMQQIQDIHSLQDLAKFVSQDTS